MSDKPKRYWIPNPKGNPKLYAYQLRGRMLKRPHYKAVQLFKAMDELKLSHKRFVFIEDSDPEHQGDLLLMTVQLEIEGVTAYIELAGRRDYELANHSQAVERRKFAHCERMNIPLLKLERKHTAQLMPWVIRRWYVRERERIIRMRELERKQNDKQPE